MVSVITKNTMISRNRLSLLFPRYRDDTLGSHVYRFLLELADPLRHESFRVHTTLILAPFGICVQIGGGKGSRL